MIILTCANKEIMNYKYGPFPKEFSFKEVISETVKKANKFGYVPFVYDLGSLGIGEKYYIDDASFQNNGFYEKEVMNGYKSKSLFKPDIVKLCMAKYKDLVVYLDGDVQLVKRIDEVNTTDYDVGVSLRSPFELETEWHRKHIEIVRYINAGVILFRPTQTAAKFVDRWHNLTLEIGNDQMALNQLACPDTYPTENSVITIDGVRIKYFPCTQYNYYYFDEELPYKAKLFHFKGTVRHYYPFNFKKGIFCITMVLLKKILKPTRK